MFSRPMILYAVLCLGVASTAVSASDSSRDSATGDPRAVVESLHAVLLDCMKGACGSGFNARYDRIAAKLDETFDLSFMARLSIGSAWSALSPEEQGAFVALSRTLSASSYASNFDSYGGQRFETLGEESAARNTILVKTEFVQPADEDVKFDYRLRESEEGWRIIDVTLDGKVSEITMRRADYGSVIKREGFPKLVDEIEKKIAKLAKK